MLASDTSRTPIVPAPVPVRAAARAPVHVTPAPARVAEAAPAPAPATTGWSLASAPATVAPMNSLFAALQLEAARKRQQAAIAAAAPAPRASGGAVYKYRFLHDAPTRRLPPAARCCHHRGYQRRARGSDGQRTLQLASAIYGRDYAVARRVRGSRATATRTRLCAADGTANLAGYSCGATRARSCRAGQLPRPQVGTTIAVKRVADQPTSAIVAARPNGGSNELQGLRFDNPWLDAMLVSPDVRHS